MPTLIRRAAIGALFLASVAALAQDVQERTIKFGHLNNTDHPVSLGVKRFAEVLAAVRSSGALDAARAHGEAEAVVAKSALAVLPDSKFRETLLQLADFAVQRSF